jgi:hypothetical protein
MVEKAPQCKFVDGDAGVKCNQIRGLQALKEDNGNAFGVKELQQIMCGSTVNNGCRAYKSLNELGKKSDFVKAVARV